MQIIIARSTHFKYRPYHFEAFCYSRAIFIVELLDEGFAQPRFLKWLEDFTDNSEQRSELWFVNKKNNHLVMTFMDEPEEYDVPFSHEQIAFILEEYLKIRNSSNYPQEMIFLLDDNKVKLKVLEVGESGGWGWHEGSILRFGGESSLTALIEFLIQVPNIAEIDAIVNHSEEWNGSSFLIQKKEKNLVISYCFDRENNFLTKTLVPQKVFLWLGQTYQQLTSQSFEQLLFYRTSEKYVFMRDMDEEIVFRY